MPNTIKATMFIALLTASASSGFAIARTVTEPTSAMENSNAFSAYAQGVGRYQGNCWMPTRDMSEEAGVDTRGLWGSCSERSAVLAR